MTILGSAELRAAFALQRRACGVDTRHWVSCDGTEYGGTFVGSCSRQLAVSGGGSQVNPVSGVRIMG